MKKIKENKFNLILSKIIYDKKFKFSYLATPTLNKQESITNLLDVIQNNDLNIFKYNKFKDPLFFILRILKQFLIYLILSIAFNKKIKKNSIIFYTWLVPKSLKKENIVDDYFRSFPKKLIQEKICTVFFHLDFNLSVKFFLKNKSKKQFMIFNFLNPLDILYIFISYLFKGYVQIKKNYYYNKLNLTPYVNISLKKDYYMMRSFHSYVINCVNKKIQTKNPKVIFYVYENQSWEKITCKYFNNKKTKIVGFQSSGFSDYFLNFFPTKYDNKRDLYPFFILANGHYPKKYLLTYGNYLCPIRKFYALRFSYQIKNNQYLIQKYKKNFYNKILYAFSVHERQYLSVLNDLKIIFGNSKINVHLKFHPRYDLTLENKNYTQNLPKNFKIVKNIKKFNYDLVLFNDNSFGLECLFKGIKCFQYNRFGNTKDNRLWYFNEWNPNVNFKQLVYLKKKLIEKKFSKKINRNKIKTYINKMYTPLDDGKKFVINNLSEFLE